MYVSASLFGCWLSQESLGAAQTPANGSQKANCSSHKWNMMMRSQKMHFIVYIFYLNINIFCILTLRLMCVFHKLVASLPNQLLSNTACSISWLRLVAYPNIPHGCLLSPSFKCHKRSWSKHS